MNNTDINDNMVYEMIDIFEEANRRFLHFDRELFVYKVSERTLCGALMIHLHEVIKNTRYSDYKIDVEYNRNKGGKLKTLAKTIEGLKDVPIKINCDLIVHSRGKNVQQDNLIAIEMKKSTRKDDEKESDRERLICLTKDSFNDVWSFDGKTLPEHVCRYKLGVYYEINFSKKYILIEYYEKGYCIRHYKISLKKFLSKNKLWLDYGENMEF